jgi:hypothetical protein
MCAPKLKLSQRCDSLSLEGEGWGEGGNSNIAVSINSPLIPGFGILRCPTDYLDVVAIFHHQTVLKRITPTGNGNGDTSLANKPCFIVNGKNQLNNQSINYRYRQETICAE